jgi:hypothetical protein
MTELSNYLAWLGIVVAALVQAVGAATIAWVLIRAFIEWLGEP